MDGNTAACSYGLKLGLSDGTPLGWLERVGGPDDGLDGKEETSSIGEYEGSILGILDIVGEAICEPGASEETTLGWLDPDGMGEGSEVPSAIWARVESEGEKLGWLETVGNRDSPSSIIVDRDGISDGVMLGCPDLVGTRDGKRELSSI
jgi:hypothetical protein